MSSYVISKKEFMKVAGFCAGLSDCKNSFREPVLRLWHYGNNKPYEDKDYKAAFTWLYKLNALSVQKQYHDTEPENDPADYVVAFSTTRKMTYNLYMAGSIDSKHRLVTAIYRYHDFVNCLLYQVEDPDCEAQVKGFVYRLEHQLMEIMKDLTDNDTEGGWPDFNF